MNKANPPSVEVLVPGIEVTHQTPADWIRATVGLHMDPPKRPILRRDEKVVELKAAPPETWRLL